MTLRGDTIAAIATAKGRGGVAIIRISGPDAFHIATALSGQCPPAGHFAYAKIHSPAPSHALLDEVLLLAFHAPHSYTGEDVVEIQCHGGFIVPQRILDAVFSAGARLAERGEFTARAFLNGRMPFEAAEGVLDLIDAKTERAADEALSHLAGEMAQRHRALYDSAVELSAALEHTLDVDESDLPPSHVAHLHARVMALHDDITRALQRLREGRLLREGLRVVLAGAPNAGKSSLMNALLGMNRAIVSAMPGTTRDTVEEMLDIGGWPVRLIDTAGLRESNDLVEREGIARTQESIARADLVVALDCEIPGALTVHAKCDLDDAPHAGLSVSAKTGQGLDDLRKAIANAIAARTEQAEASDADDRQVAALREAQSALTRETNELVVMANGVRTAAETLGRLVGQRYSDDMLDALFSRFCIGK